MTPVTSRTVERARRAEVLVSVVLLGSLAWCGAVVVMADRRAPRHGVLRDPISWFASREASDPERLRHGLAAVGLGLVVLGILGWFSGRSHAATAVATIAGGLVVGIARTPLDCSVRFEYCEKLVAAGFASDAHLVHVALSGGLVLLACVVTVGVAWRRRSPGALLLAVVAVGAAGAILAEPTWEFLGTLQLAVLGAGAVAAVRLWRGDVGAYPAQPWRAGGSRGDESV